MQKTAGWFLMAGALVTTLQAGAARPASFLTDFDGDKKADLSVFHAAVGDWYVFRSGTGTQLKRNWGSSATLPVPADYDGDGKADLAVYDKTSGNWYIIQSSNGSTSAIFWSAPGVVPVPGDYDGDGKCDIAVYLPDGGQWGIRLSTTKDLLIKEWGWAEAKAVPGDYDGDGKADLAVYHSAKGDWYIKSSSTGRETIRNWGWKDAYPVPADYDGDGRTDMAVFHPAQAMWYVLRSRDGLGTTFRVGTTNGLPVPADYDGDGKSDPAVYRQSNGVWNIYSSTAAGIVNRSWGWADARAVGNPLWSHYRGSVAPASTNPTPVSLDAIDVSKCVTLSKHRDVKPVNARITKRMYSAVIEGSNVRMSFETPLNWSTTSMNGKTVDGRCYIFWYEGATLYGGHFDWHGLNQTVKTLKNIPGGYLDGKSPAKGMTVWFCLINREGDQRTNVVKCDNAWPGF